MAVEILESIEQAEVKQEEWDARELDAHCISMLSKARQALKSCIGSNLSLPTGDL